jgi:hypothetical protein
MNETVLRMANGGSYVAIAALVIWALVTLLKSSVVRLDIPPRVRPWVAFGLGQVYAVLVVILEGAPPGQAAVQGIMATVLAIGGQELGSSAALNTTSIGGLSLLVCLLGSAGCSTAQLEAGLDAGNKLVTKAKPCLVATFEAEREACGGDVACVRDVEEGGRETADAAKLFREAWCALAEDAQAKGCP